MHKLFAIAAVLVGSIGCMAPLKDLPLVDEVPIEPVNRCSAEREAVVACVIDGDTFDIGQCGDGGERIRMLGIDAPEAASQGEPAECWADIATQELRRRIEGRNVTLTFDLECTDVFGRTLAFVWVDSEDGDFVEMLNTVLVREGFVRVFEEEFGETVFQQEFVIAQNQAQSLGVGLWGACEAP